MTGFNFQTATFTGNSGSSFGIPGSGVITHVSNQAQARSTGSFRVACAAISATGYFHVDTNGVGAFNITFTAIPLGSPVIVAGILSGVDSNTTADNVKAALDADPDIFALYQTTVQHDTPALGKARVAITAKKLGEAYNALITTESPGGGVYRILDGSALHPALTTRMTGGTNTATWLVLDDYHVLINDVLAALPIVFTTYPALVNDTATKEAIATALAAAIARLPGFSASAVSVDVSILGPTGPDGGTIPFRFYQSGITGFTLVTPSTNVLVVGTPTLAAPEIT